MSDQFFIRDAAKILSSQEAAMLYGVTNDYVARLCRQGKLKGRLEGRMWYIERASLEGFFTEGVKPAAVLPQAPSFVSSVDAARMYRVSNDYVARLCRQGKVAGQLRDRVWYADTASLKEFFGKAAAVEVAEPMAAVPVARIVAASAPARVSAAPVRPVARKTNLVWLPVALGFLFVIAAAGAYGIPATGRQEAALARIESPFFAPSFSSIGATLQKLFASFAPQDIAQAPDILVGRLPQTQDVSLAVATTTESTGDTYVTNTYPVVERTTIETRTEAPDTSTFVTYQFLAQQVERVFDTVADHDGGSSGGGSVDFGDLVAGDIPDLSGLYLPLSGGMLTGALTVGYASTTVLSATSLCLSTDCRTVWPTAGSSFDYPFPSNATTTFLAFGGGLTSYASTTIGAGGQATGLTISGGATTTGNAYFAGNVGVGTTTPSLDYLLSLDATNANDNSRALSILQANDAAEDTYGFYLANTAGQGSITGGTRNITNYYGTLVPTLTFGTTIGVNTVNVMALDNNLSLSGLTFGDSVGTQSRAFAYGNKALVSGSPTVSDTDTTGLNLLTAYGTYSSVAVTPTFSSADGFSFGATGGFFSNTSGYSTGDPLVSQNILGIDVTSASALSTVGTTAHFGGRFTVSGTAGDNYGLQISSVSDATNNYGLRIDTVAAAATNYAIYSSAAAQSYFAGNVGIGTTSPYRQLSVGNSAVFGDNVLAAYFTSTSTTQASTFPYASTTALSATSLCLSTDCRTAWPTAGSSFSYPFPSNATTTPLAFGGGLTSFASSTIGAGGQTTGLTIFGGATTTATSSLNGLLVRTGNVGIGSSSPNSLLTLSAANPAISLTNSTGNNGWRLQVPSSGALNFVSHFAGLANNSNLLTLAAANSAGLNPGQVIIGTTTNYSGNPSRLFVWGGLTGANIDVMGDPTIVGGDQATLELQSSTWPTTFKSAYLQYLNHGIGSNMGFANTELAQLVLGGDTNLIYTNQLLPIMFGTGNVERMRLAAAGQLGIGTTSPMALLALHAKAGTTNTTLFAIGSSTASATTTHFVINNIGNVGIGTTSPASTLDVFKSNSTSNAGNAATGFSATSFMLSDSGNLTATRSKNAIDATVIASGTYGSGVGSTFFVNGVQARPRFSGAFNDSGNGDELYITGVNSQPVFSGSVGASTGSLNVAGFLTEVGSALGTTGTTRKFGVYANVTGTADTNYGLYIHGVSGATDNYAIYSAATAQSYFAGNVGIGTTTPGSLFAIEGVANFQAGTSTLYENLNVQGQLKVGTGSIYLNSLATSTFAAGINLSGGCYAVNNTCISSGSASLTGTQGQVAYFSGTNTAAGTSSLVISTAGNVGIGSTTPSYKLTVENSSAIGIAARITSSTGAAGVDVLGDTNRRGSFFKTGTAYAGYKIIAANDMGFYNDTNAGNMSFLNDYASGDILFAAGGASSAHLTVKSLGNVGVGTTTPDSKFSVASTTAFGISDFVNFSVTSTPRLTFGHSASTTRWSMDNSSGDLRFFSSASNIGSGGTVAMTISGAKRNVGIGTATPEYKLSINSTNDTDNLLQVSTTTNQNIFTVNSSGYVGIGTATAEYQLGVVGNIPGTANVMFKNTNVAGISGFDAIDDDGTLQSRIGYDNTDLKTVVDSVANSLALRIAGVDRLTVLNTGNVGIATSSPWRTFSVDGTVALAGIPTLGEETFLPLCWSPDTSEVKRSTMVNSCDAADGDIAENYGTEEPVERGMIVSLGSTVASRDFDIKNPDAGEQKFDDYTITTAKVRKARSDDRSRIIGAVPTAPFMIGSDIISPEDNPEPIALVGHVPVKMTLDGGDVAIGDPITVSYTHDGWGAKATSTGRIVGWALEDFSAGEQSVDGMIEVYVAPQDWIAPKQVAALVDLVDFADASSTATSSPFMSGFLAGIKSVVSGWLADAGNGIAQIFAETITAKVAYVHDLKASNTVCVGQECFTEDDVRGLLEMVRGSSDNNGEDEPPVDQNPSTGGLPQEPVEDPTQAPPAPEAPVDEPAAAQVPAPDTQNAPAEDAPAQPVQG